jgi:hypothetical protein
MPARKKQLQQNKKACEPKARRPYSAYIYEMYMIVKGFRLIVKGFLLLGCLLIVVLLVVVIVDRLGFSSVNVICIQFWVNRAL